MGPDCCMGTVACVDVVWLRAIMSVITTLGLNGIMPVLQNAALMFAGVSVFACTSVKKLVLSTV